MGLLIGEVGLDPARPAATPELPGRAHRMSRGGLAVGAPGAVGSDEPQEVTAGFVGRLVGEAELRRDLEVRGHVVPRGDLAALLIGAYRQWGSEFVAHLKGRFVVALVDHTKPALLLARDRFGSQPLYVRVTDDRVAFGTSLGPMLRHGLAPRILEPSGVSAYFEYGFVPSPLSLIRGVQSIPPGASWIFDRRGRRAVAPSWDLTRPDDVTSFDEQLERAAVVLEGSLQDEVEDASSLAIAFTPTVLEQTLAGLVIRHRTDSLTVFGPPPPDGEPAARAANLLGLPFETRPTEPDPDAVGRWIGALPSPTADPAWLTTAMVLDACREAGRTLISPIGGEALFATNPRYPELLVQDAVRRALPDRLEPSVLRMGRRWGGPLPRAAQLGSALHRQGWTGCLRPDFHALTPPELPGRSDGTVGALQQAELRYGVGDHRWPTARAVAEAVEGQLVAPYLHPMLVEAVGRWPLRARMEGSQAGPGLRTLARRILPSRAFEPASGPAPQPGAWLRGSLRDQAQEALFGSRVSGVLDPGRMRRHWYALQLGWRDHGSSLFAAFCFEEWCARVLGSDRRPLTGSSKPGHSDLRG
jgi:asparagine synthetase B (glutamine-hydrolysing)